MILVWKKAFELRVHVPHHTMSFTDHLTSSTRRELDAVDTAASAIMQDVQYSIVGMFCACAFTVGAFAPGHSAAGRGITALTAGVWAFVSAHASYSAHMNAGYIRDRVHDIKMERYRL